MLLSISKIYSFLVAEDYMQGSCFKMFPARELPYLFQTNPMSFDALKRCDKLIIDDLGDDAAEVVIYGSVFYPMIELLMYRYEKRLLTFVSSNLNVDLIRQKYRDERLLDRMREMFKVIAFHDKSFR